MLSAIGKLTKAVVLGLTSAYLCVSPVGAQSKPAAEWGKRAPLLEPNSEMAVAELGGRFISSAGIHRTGSASIPCRSMISSRIAGD